MSDRRKTIPAAIALMLAFFTAAVTIGESDPLLAFAVMIPLFTGACVLFSFVYQPESPNERTNS
jgi:hypothetical protein